MKLKKWLPLPFLGVFFCVFFNLFFAIIGFTLTEDPVADNATYAVFQNAQWLLILVEAILAPILEEFLFRKLLLGALMKKLPFIWAAVISAALFGILHLNLVQGVYAFVFGMLLAEVFRKNGTFLATVVVHATHNIFALLMNFSPALNAYFVENSGPFVAVSGVLLLVTFGLYEFFTREEKHPEEAVL